MQLVKLLPPTIAWHGWMDGEAAPPKDLKTSNQECMPLVTQTMRCYFREMGPFKITLDLYGLIPPKWVPFNDPCATKQGYDYHQSEASS